MHGSPRQITDPFRLRQCVTAAIAVNSDDRTIDTVTVQKETISMIRAIANDNESTVRCATCDERNTPRAHYCPTCLTPLELSRSVISRGTTGHYISVLGASGAGKTVYLGFLLDMLSKGVGDLRGLSNGAFTVGVQQETMTALQRRQFPEKTSVEADRWQWVHCEITRKNRTRNVVDLVAPDFAGEAIAMQIEKASDFRTIDYVVRRSRALLLLIDSVQVRDASREQDFFAMKLASYIRALHANGGYLRRGRLRIPVAIVMTKADMCCEAQTDPFAFAKANLPGFVHACERSFGVYGLFAAGVVGSTATLTGPFGDRAEVPLHIEPHGIVEPLEWVMKKL
jgi:hypothetical protein